MLIHRPFITNCFIHLLQCNHQINMQMRNIGATTIKLTMSYQKEIKEPSHFHLTDESSSLFLCLQWAKNSSLSLRLAHSGLRIIKLFSLMQSRQ